ncbi:MAG: hypothetical protein ACO3FE_17640, partial [Planctomycetaceae bacterium]
MVDYVDEVLGIAEKQRKSANLAEALRKSLRLRQYFGLSQYGIVSLRVTTRAEALRKSLRLRQYFGLSQYEIVSLPECPPSPCDHVPRKDDPVKCDVIHSGAVVRSLDAHQIAQLPEDV